MGEVVNKIDVVTALMGLPVTRIETRGLSYFFMKLGYECGKWKYLEGMTRLIFFFFFSEKALTMLICPVR